ncbi:MAG: AtpZ/AtpI family protein [Holosporaceae bacterium]|nr:AtpZ/AtpI family protein [Holosporaceae bacterium]
MKNLENKPPAGIASCGIEFVSAIAVGVCIGLWLDKRFDKFPLFLIAFFLFGCVAGYFNVLKLMKKPKK